MQIAPDWTWYRDANGWHFMTPWWVGPLILVVIIVGALIAACVSMIRQRRRRERRLRKANEVIRRRE